MQRSTWKSKLLVLLSALFLLGLWHLASVLIASPVLLPQPLVVGQAFSKIVRSTPFALNIWATVVRAVQSFFIIVISGTLLGLLAGYSPSWRALMLPILAICKATPVMSVILLAFIWFTSGTVPLFSAFLMGFPVMFVQVEGAVGMISADYLEMAKLYQLSKASRLRHIIFPALAPAIATGAKAALAMVWKVVIAAEVLTVPRYGVGSRLQLSQINLETDSVLGWTLIAIVLTALGDIFFDFIIKFPHYITARRHEKVLKTLEVRL